MANKKGFYMCRCVNIEKGSITWRTFRSKRQIQRYKKTTRLVEEITQIHFMPSDYISGEAKKIF